MAVSLEMEMDLAGESFDLADSGGMLAPGWHRAIVADVSLDEKNDGIRLDFEVTAGRCQGAKTHMLLFDPDGADDAAKQKRATDRMRTISLRLGLISKEDFDAKRRVKFSWMDAINREVAIECAMDKEKKYCNVMYLGVYPLSHEKVPTELKMKDGPDFEADEPRRAEAATGAGGVGKPNGSGKKPMNLDDL